MRLFVAVAPDDVTRAAAAAIRDRVRAVAPAAARWGPDSALHVTLAFLGAIDEALVEPLRNALASAVGGIPPFDVSLGRPGAFPSPTRPRVLWIGVSGGALCGLAAAVRAAMARFPVEPEERPFRPHLTIARMRSPSRAPTLAADLARVEVPDVRWRVRTVTLFESVSDPGGPSYRALATVSLGGE